MRSGTNSELDNRQQKRIERFIRESKLPVGKTLDSFNFTTSKSVNAAQITGIANNIDWVKDAENLVIFGPSGVGKTHL
ncbi:MAG: ATP-binding protein, partial [Alphaproteobacteria bacterium]